VPTFSVALDPPLASSDEVRARLAHMSAERYGRAVAEVDADIQAADARLASLPTTTPASQVPASSSGADDHAAKRARNQHRPRRKRARRSLSEEVIDP
jgi:hypothetical protein